MLNGLELLISHVWVTLYKVKLFTAAELQSSSMMSTTCGPPEAGVSQGDAHSSTQDESWRNGPVDPEHQMECVVA